MRYECDEDTLRVDSGHHSNTAAVNYNNDQMDEICITQRNVHQMNNDQYQQRRWPEYQQRPNNDESVYYIYEIGLYGIRRLLLYSMLAVIIISVILNVILIVWITSIVSDTSKGIGRLKANPKGIHFDGHSLFSRHVYATAINTKDSVLRILSSKAIALNVKYNEHHGVPSLSNRVNIVHRTVAGQCNRLLFRGEDGRVLMILDDNNVLVNVDQLCIQTKHGFDINGSIQAPLVKLASNDELKLQSLTRNIRLKSAKQVSINASNSGDINIKSLKQLIFTSKTNALMLRSNRIELPKLRTALPTRRGRTYPAIYQLCSCGHGKLFISLPDISCQLNANICDVQQQQQQQH